MPQIFNQSAESKYLKRINEQLADINRLTAKEAQGVENNPLIAKWSRAISESGLEYSKVDGRYKIRNTKENREKVNALENALKKYKAQTAGEFRAEIKKELEAEAEKISGRFYKGDTKEAKRKRKKLEKHLVDKSKIQERVKIRLQEYEIQNMLDYIYQYEGNNDFGQVLSDLTSGKKHGERDSRKIFNEFGRIRKHYIDLMYSNIKSTQEETKNDLADFLSDMALGEAFPDEVHTNGNLAKTRKRGTKK